MWMKLMAFMELQNAPPCSQSPPLDPILSQLDPVHIITFYSLKIRVNIIAQSSPSSPLWCPPVWFSALKFVCICNFLHSSRMFCVSSALVNIFCEYFKLKLFVRRSYIRNLKTSVICYSQLC